MLAAIEFSAGTIGEATPLTLVLPRSSYDPTALIGKSIDGGVPAIFFLDERHGFQWFECPDNAHWKGILVPNVTVEVDENTAFDPEMTWPKLGCVVRQDDRLVAIAKASHPGTFHGTQEIMLLDDLPSGSQKVAFTRWQISLGKGIEKRILLVVDADR